MLKSTKNENDSQDFAHKKNLWRQIMAQKMGLKKIKALNNRGNELNLMNQYGEKLINKKERQDHLQNRISEMEQREQMLLEKLQNTQNKQRQAYNSLENMVSVGYNYYSQCYELKKKKLNEQYPHTSGNKGKNVLLDVNDGKWGNSRLSSEIYNNASLQPKNVPGVREKQKFKPIPGTSTTRANEDINAINSIEKLKDMQKVDSLTQQSGDFFPTQVEGGSIESKS